MKLFFEGHDFRYEASNLCYLFFPGEKVEVAAPGEEKSGDWAYIAIRRRRRRIYATVIISRGEKSQRALSSFDCTGFSEGAVDPKECVFAMGRAFYRAASRLCGFYPPWGILTGIRPVKLAREKMNEGMSREDVASLFTREYYVSEEKTRICLQTAGREERIVRLSRPESFSLYISIPFCPSRCLYCSFISHDVEKMAKLLPQYVELLCREIELTGKLAADLGLKLETVYMGGGTPTSLSAGDLSKILGAVGRCFNLDTLREYTVEAGRPDTITKEKLEAIKDAGADRISINPQTLDDRILKRIGRNHSSDDIRRAYALARQTGIACVNMDLIAGLPGDNPEGFAATVAGVIGLGPEAVTVHTLAMKRSSRLVTSGGAPYNASAGDVGRMLEDSARMLTGAGYSPYYLYRQKNTLGNLENTGWSLPDCEGLYNVFIMDETHTVLAVGAGGVSKLREPCGGRIERIFNFKYPYEYISRFQEIVDRKSQVIKFYDEYNSQSKNQDQ